MKRVVGDHPLWKRAYLSGGKSKLNATVLSLNLARYANGVARRRGEVSREMFPGYDIDSVTNGVHAATGASPPMRKLFDRWTPEWRTHNQDLRMANAIDDASLLRAHDEVKQDLPTAHLHEGLKAVGIFWADYGESLGEKFHEGLLQ